MRGDHLNLPSVDVIVPCYRYGHFLEECVRSVVSQEGVSVRVLIIDDASPDHTAEVGRELQDQDPRVTFRRHAENLRHIATYNEGIDWIASSYYLLLSADDYLVPGALRRATELMETDETIGFTFGQAFELSDRELKRVWIPFADDTSRRIMSGREFIDISGAKNLVPTPTAVIRTELQKRVGGYRPELPHSGDMEMWLRLAAHANVGFVNEVQAVYRKHADNMSRSYNADWLPDVRQRKLALEHFFSHNRSALAGGEALRAKVFSALAKEAISFASAAFNRGESATMESFIEIALDLSPGVKKSPEWRKLSLKRLLGRPAWDSLQKMIMCFGWGR